ncbi:MAG: DUF2306 domain-containing protein, partial [Ferruginibacter sp.]
MTKKIPFIIVAILSVLISLLTFTYYIICQQEFNLLQNKTVLIQNSLAWKIAFYTHIFFGSIALLIGWIQFVSKWRVQKINLHRTVGKIYVVSVLFSSIAGLGIGIFATGGWIAVLGFITLGLIWFYSTFKAYSSIRAGKIENHKKWMIYSYAICFAAVTLRIWLPILIIVFGEFLMAYRIVAWLCWIPNLLVGYFIINKKKSSTQI